MTDKSLDEWMDDDVPGVERDDTGETVAAPAFEVANLNHLDGALRTMRRRQTRVEDRNAQADAWIATVEAWRAQANATDLHEIARLEAMCEAYHRRELDAAIEAGLPEKEWPKSITAPHGRLTSTAGREKIEVDKEYDVLWWLRNRGIEAPIKESLLTSELRKLAVVADKDGQKVLVIEGEVVEGVHVEVGDRSYKVKPEVPETKSRDEAMVPCRPCAGTGEFPPTGGVTCSWCGGKGEVDEV